MCSVIENLIKEEIRFVNVNRSRSGDVNHPATIVETMRFAEQIIDWCIQNYIPLKQFSSSQIHVIFYEELCTQPDHEFKRLFTFLERQYDQSIYDQWQQASNTSHRVSSAILTGASLTESWKQEVTEQKIQRAIDILARFGLDRIYSKDTLPHSENLFEFMKNE